MKLPALSIPLALFSAIAVGRLACGMDGESTQIRFTHHHEGTGLSSIEVKDILLDKTGWLWMATSKGLNQFNVFNNYFHTHLPNNNNSLSSNRLSCLSPGLKGRIWVGTLDAGLNQFDPETRTVLRVYPGQFVEGKIDARALPSRMITALGTSEEHFLWIGTDRGLSVMNLISHKIKVASGPISEAVISCISVFDNRDVWVGTSKGEIFQWDNKQSEFKKTHEFAAPVKAIGRDLQLRVWVGTEGLGLFQLLPEGSIPQFSEQIRDVTSLLTDENGDFWIGTNQGLNKMSRNGQSFRTFHNIKGENDSLIHNSVTKVFQDKQRRMIWIATLGGVSRFSLDKYWFPLIKHGEQDISLPHPSIWSMEPSGESGNVWMGTENGVFLWDARSQAVETSLPGLPEIGNSYAIALAEDQEGNLWVGTRGKGLIRRRPDGTIKHYSHFAGNPESLAHNYVSELFVDRDGYLWVGTHGQGINLFDPINETFVRQSATQGKLDFITRIRQDEHGRLWAGTTESLFVLETNDSEWKQASAINKGLEEVRGINALLVSGSLIWIGTARGELIRFSLQDNKITRYTQKQGLPDDAIVSLARDPSGFIWIATHNGLSRMDSENLIRNFTRSDGLQAGFFRPNAFATSKQADGQPALIFGGSEGFNPIDPKKFPLVFQPPLPFLTAFEFFDQEIIPEKGGLLEKPLSSTSLLTIPYDARNQFALRFSNLDYRFPNQGYFRYRLEDFDADWIVADQKRRASYRSLPPGMYRFKVQNSPDGKKWSDESMAHIKIKIAPPWWAAWWFRIPTTCLLIAAVLLGLRSVYQNRISAIKRREAAISAQRDKAEVALARQLQYAMLLERTSRGFNHSEREDEIFTNPLKSLAEHFMVDYGMIYRVTTDPADEDEEIIKRIANYSITGKPLLPTLPLEFSHGVVQTALHSESSFAVETPETISRFLFKIENKPEINSILFVGTRFLGKPNGLIALLSSRKASEWDLYEIKLFNALSPQFGMSIAQLKLAENEKKYLQHLEEARHQAEVANRAKSDFLAKMTHELRTPLNSIIGFTEIVQEDETLSPKQRELIEIVNHSGDHLLDVINDILDLSKIEAGKIEKSEESFELAPLLKSVHEMLGMKAKSKRIGFEFAARSALPTKIFSDRSKLRQILINLIGNAIKFTDQGAVTMAVGASVIGDPVEENGLNKRRVRLSFEVADTGKGIAKEDLPKLFQKYSQTESGLRSSEGTGLGLPIAKSFIQLLGGDVRVQSEYGKGTSFYFFIECDEVANVASEKESPSLTEAKVHKITGVKSQSGDKVRILIAEDQPNNRFLLRKILMRAGFEMREAHNGQEAVELNAEFKPHLILMDEDMPVKKGSEATREILRQEGVDHPVIISLTAYALEQARQSALEAGCQDFLAKPFKAHEIFTAISRHLNIDYTFDEAGEKKPLKRVG